VSAKAIRDRGLTVDELISKVKTLGPIEGPWSRPHVADDADTLQERPSAKRPKE
jgi:hypothetical protein